jgi:uncharacterized membrane protein HdeD (DUF308 family)
MWRRAAGKPPVLNSVGQNEETNMATVAMDSRSRSSGIWWLFLLQGIAAILMGVMLLAAPGQTLLALITFLGFYWLITGVLELVRMFVDRSVSWIWSLLTGLIGIAAGLLVLKHPLLAAVTVPTVLVILLGVQGLVMGAIQIMTAFKGGGIGSFLLGAINVALGLLLLSSPLAASLAVPFVFGVLLLIQGAALTIWAFRLRA